MSEKSKWDAEGMMAIDGFGHRSPAGRVLVLIPVVLLGFCVIVIFIVRQCAAVPPVDGKESNIGDVTATAIASQKELLESALSSPEDASKNASAEIKVASNSNGHFAVDLYRKIAESKSGENIFLAPFSVSTALAIAAEGAVDQTLDQMTDVLHIPRGGLSQHHRGERELLQAAMPFVPPDVTPEVTERISQLRTELKKSNDRTQAIIKTGDFIDATASQAAGNALAKEINALVGQTAAYELRIANSLWLEASYPIQPDFVSTLKPNYGTVLFSVDFKTSPDVSRGMINQWVAEQTNDRIQNLLAPGSITDLTKLVITYSVYFKGDWAQPFEPTATRNRSFHISGKKSVKVPMMQQRNSTGYGAFESSGDLFSTPHEIRVDLKDDDPSMYPDSNGHTMISLDYQGHKIQMILLVPQSANGITELEKSLTYDKLQKWIGQLERRTVNLSVPKYKLEATYQLNKTLKSLGMVRCFEVSNENALGAQFDKLTSSDQTRNSLSISDVVHKTYIDVSEVGTEAAAAAGAILSPGDLARPKTRPFIPIFIADKPFLFLIRDRETANILFIGRYVNPI